MSATNSTEAQFVQMAKAGEKAGVEALYRKYFAPIYRFCYWQTNKSADAEDLAQDIFIEMAKSIRTFRGDASFKNWLYQIAKHKIAAWLKKKYRLPTSELYETISDTEEWIDPENEKLKEKIIHDLLQKLSPTEKEVLTLRYLKNFSVEETAQKLHLSAVNVKVMCHRSLKKLQNQDVT